MLLYYSQVIRKKFKKLAKISNSKTQLDKFMEQRNSLSIEKATANDDESAGPSSKKPRIKKPNSLNLDLVESEDEPMENIGDAQRPVNVSPCTNQGDKTVHNATPHKSDAQLDNQNSNLEDNHTPENSDSEDESPEKSNEDLIETPEDSNDEIDGTPQNSPRRNKVHSPPHSPEHELENNQVQHVETPRARRPRFKEFTIYRPKARGIDVIIFMWKCGQFFYINTNNFVQVFLLILLVLIFTDNIPK